MKSQIAKGAAWMVMFRVLDRSIGIVSTALLARLLLPDDFGLVAMAMSVIAVIELASAFSFEIVLIQMRDPQRQHFDTAWTLNVMIACGGAVVTAAAAMPAAAFFSEPRLVPVMLAIGAAWLVQGFENIGIVNFRREMNFSAEFRLMAAKRLIAFAATVVSVLLLGSYWALIIGMATGRVAGVLLSYLMHPYRPRLSLAHARGLFSFSGWMLLNNILGVGLGRLPHFAVGRLFGPQLLGAYTVASEIANLAQTELVAPINRAMFPGYARLVSDLPAFRKVAVDATAMILLIALPVSVGIAVLAGPFVRLLLGAQWGAAVPIIQVLAVAGTLTAMTTNNISVYLALGRPSMASTTLAVRLGVLVLGISVVGASAGVLGIAYAELASAAASLLVSVPTLLRALGLSAREYLRALWRPLVASALMGWAIMVVIRPGFHAEQGGRAAFELLAGTLMGCVTYPLIVALLWGLAGHGDAVEAQLVRRLWAEIGKRRAARAQG